jgi:hypothetical protein
VSKLKADSDPEGVKVVVDSEAIGTTPIEPGEHQVQLTYKGHELANRTIAVREGATETRSIPVGETPSKVPGMLALGSGVAALGTGGAFIYVGQRARRQVRLRQGDDVHRHRRGRCDRRDRRCRAAQRDVQALAAGGGGRSIARVPRLGRALLNPPFRLPRARNPGDPVTMTRGVVLPLALAGCGQHVNPEYCAAHPGDCPADAAPMPDAAACEMDNQCGQGVCDLSQHVCVECLPDDNKCQNPTPVCSEDHHCVQPTCTSGVALPDGTCADAARILYVGPDGTSAGNDCSMANHCTLTEALGRLASGSQDIIHLDDGTYTGPVHPTFKGGGMDGDTRPQGNGCDLGADEYKP